MSVTFTAEDAPLGAPEIDLNGRNAVDLLTHLGLPIEQDGAVAGEDLLGRVLLALALLGPDEGIESAAAGRYVSCGRRPGYLQERLGDLHDLAEWCWRRSCMVVWA